MQLIGESIRHDVFGQGVVTDWNERCLTIRFGSSQKKFLYPDAFADHLTLKNPDKQTKIEGLLQSMEDEEESRRRELLAEEKRRQVLRRRTGKISSCSQAAFDVEDPDAALRDWEVSTGVYLSGYSKGQPKTPERMKPNSLCLITHCPKGAPEKERRIAGVFMVQEDFLGSSCKNGIVRAHPVYRIGLAPDARPAFWPYTGVESDAQRWGRAGFKYMANTLAERILFDICESIGDCEEKETACRMYRYFCKLNRLPERKSGE